MYTIWFIIALLIILSFLSIHNKKIKALTILGYIFFLYLQIAQNNVESLFLKIILLMTTLLIIYTLIKKSDNEEHLLILMAMTGLFTLIESSNLFTIFLALELQAFVGYTLVRNKTSFLSAEAALKYFLIGTVASAIFILGVALIYGQLGSIDYYHIIQLQEKNEIVIVGGILTVIALIFKIGAVPFHLWVPDVYSGATYETLLFISIFPKIFLFLLLKNIQKICETQGLIIVIIILSLLLGSIQAVKQQKIKKFISYTIIYNNGFFLSLTILPTVYSDHVQFLALFFYLLSSFLILFLFQNYRSLNMHATFQNIRDILLIQNSNSRLLLPLSLSFFALIGIPPMSNFLFKTMLFSELLDKGLWFITTLLILFSVLPSFYYLRIISTLHFQSSMTRTYLLPITQTNAIIINVLAFIIITSLFYFNELMHLLLF